MYEKGQRDRKKGFLNVWVFSVASLVLMFYSNIRRIRRGVALHNRCYTIKFLFKRNLIDSNLKTSFLFFLVFQVL